MIILIDDERSFKPQYETDDTLVFRTSRAALNWLETVTSETQIDQVWFDHDLGIVDGKIDSTIPVLSKLEELCFYGEQPQIHQIIVHTSNTVGGDQIVKSMQRYFPTVRVFAGDYLVNTVR